MLFFWGGLGILIGMSQEGLLRVSAQTPRSHPARMCHRINHRCPELIMAAFGAAIRHPNPGRNSVPPVGPHKTLFSGTNLDCGGAARQARLSALTKPSFRGQDAGFGRARPDNLAELGQSGSARVAGCGFWPGLARQPHRPSQIPSFWSGRAFPPPARGRFHHLNSSRRPYRPCS